MGKYGGDMVSLEENKEIVRRSTEVINSHDLSLVDDLVATDYVDHTREIRSLEAFKQFGIMPFNAFPDFARATLLFLWHYRGRCGLTDRLKKLHKLILIGSYCW